MIDFSVAFIALLLIWPILLVVAIWLKLANKGDAFFFQERPGKDEKIFKLIKFKSMTDQRDEYGNLLPDAQRLTKAGRFVRATSLDELPQLLNVLKGDMSLIGPRPLLVQYLSFYTEEEKKRHLVRPGITGLSQITGRNNLKWDKRLSLDVMYIENITFRNDLIILFKTIINVISRKDVVVIPGVKYKPLNIERGKL